MHLVFKVVIKTQKMIVDGIKMLGFLEQNFNNKYR